MSSIDDRIVAMKFDNKQFESGARSTMSILDRLKAALNFNGASKGLSGLQAATNRFSLSKMQGGITGVSSKFLAMSAVGISALASLTSKAVDAGLRIAQGLFKPIQQGFTEYETKLGSVQTILANTQASGTKLKDVNAALQELNEYSDQTIYNFAEMAKNIGTFTAAGVDLETATGSIKGIANLAALSGSNSQQASTAMYQLSQAISAGKVSLQDWNSVVNAGMGGSVFQRALAQTAEKMGTLDKGAVKLTGKMKNATINGKSFRESIMAKPGEKSWLTSDVLTKTLQQFTGDLSDADLAAQGFSKSQIKAIQAQAATAKAAATEVKTFTQLMGTLQESSASGWAQTFEILIGDFEEAKKLWTQVNDVVGGFINRSSEARNEMLKQWKDLGGRTKLLAGLKNIFAAIGQIVKPIGQAFRDIFPATTGKQLYAITTQFLKFTKILKIGASDVDNIRRTARGFFAILSIGAQIVGGILGVIGKLFGLVTSGSGGFLEITGDIGDFLVSLDKTIKKGDLVNKFFENIGKYILKVVDFLKPLGPAFAQAFQNLGKYLKNPLAKLKTFASKTVGFFKGMKFEFPPDFAENFGRIVARIRSFAPPLEFVQNVFWGFVDVLKQVGKFLQPIGEKIGKALSGVGTSIADAFKTGDFSGVHDAINTGLLAGIILLIRKFFKDGLNIDFGGGLLKGIKDTFGQLTKSLEALQTQVQAKTLMLIAAAVAILVASIVVLSLIDSKKLTTALTGIAVGLGMLMISIKILSDISSTPGVLKIPILAASMVLLSAAVLILAFAMKKMSDLDWEAMGRGLTGLAALIAGLIVASFALNKSGPAMIKGGLALLPMAYGLNVLADAVKKFAELTWDEIIRGLIAMAAALGIIAGALLLMNGAIVGAASLAIVVLSLMLLVPVLERFAAMDWESIGKAMVVLAGSLLILAGGLFIMTSAIAGAAALILIAIALTVLAPVLERFGEMEWEEIGKAMVVLAGSLAIMALAMAAMVTALPGAAALLIITAALIGLTPVLVILGTMSWDMIIKGLATLGGVFVVFAIGGMLIGPVVPILVLLAAALIGLGIATVLVGSGLSMIAHAFVVFVAAATLGMGTLTAMINLIPTFMAKFAEGIGAFVLGLAAQAGKFQKAFVALLNGLLDAIIEVTPKIGKAFTVIINTALDVISDNIHKFVAVGIKVLLALLEGINKNIDRIVRLASSIMIKFMNGLRKEIPRLAPVATALIVKFIQEIGKNTPKLIAAGQKTMIKFINDMATAIRSNSAPMGAAGGNLATAIIEGIVSGLGAGIQAVANKAAQVALNALSAAKNALGINSPSKEFIKVGASINEGLTMGIDRYAGSSLGAAERVARNTVDVMKSQLGGVSQALSGTLDFDPVITPVLDLSKITRDATTIGNLLEKNAGLATQVTFEQANGISLANLEREDNDDNDGSGGITTIFDYTQNITSPKSISPIEVYRGTRSQISMLKEELKHR